MPSAAKHSGQPRARTRSSDARPVHRDFGLSDATALEVFYAMLVSRELGQAALKLAFQGVIDVSIPSDGHEAAQIASIRALRPTDPVYLFYRSVPA
ncbi:MAG TPA: hypothetical protein VGK33_18425, partial [Chloroflexota bacterium]